MTIEEYEQGTFRIALRGELDAARAYSFEEEMRRLEARHPKLLVLDLRRLMFMDSAGLGRLLALHRRSRKAGHRLVVVRGSRTVQRLFAITALDTQFEQVSDPATVIPGAA